MKYFLVEVLWNDPFPKKSSYRTEGGTLSSAVGKAVRQFRSENKGRRIKTGTIRFHQYATDGVVTSPFVPELK